jgi:hypothetical protein
MAQEKNIYTYTHTHTYPHAYTQARVYRFNVYMPILTHIYEWMNRENLANF